MSRWTYIDEENKHTLPDLDTAVFVSAKTGEDLTDVALAYIDYGDNTWRFADDSVRCWKDESLEENGWYPYAWMRYDIPEPAEEMSD